MLLDSGNDKGDEQHAQTFRKYGYIFPNNSSIKVSVYYIALASTVTGTEFEKKKKINSLINFNCGSWDYWYRTFSKIKKFHFNDLTVQ